MIDAEKLKQNTDIVEIIGRFVNLKKEGSGFKGCCPFHDEKTPSFNVNPAKQTYKCFGCDVGGDVIEFIEQHQGIEFKAACEYLGAEQTDEKPTPRKKQPDKEPQKKGVPVPLSHDDARNHYTTDIIQGMADHMFKATPKKLVKAWTYKNENGDVELVAARFEDENGKKSVLSMYWDGKSVKMKNYPVLLYNRDRLHNEPEKDVLIVFGEKCAEIADSIGMIGATWNGGEKKIIDVDLAPLKNRTVYLWPDDDDPGKQCAKEVVEKLPHVQTVEIIKELRKIEPKGADIAEAMEYFKGDTEAVLRHIYDTAKKSERPTLPTEKLEASSEREPPLWPFKILGLADDGRAYYIGSNDRMYSFELTGITRNKMLNLVGVEWWRDTYGKDKDSWEEATSDLIQVSSIPDFDPDIMRGRGAWSEDDGRICYHDGKNTAGEFSETRIYLRRAIKDIGIGDAQASADIREAIYKACEGLTFETPADLIFILGWCVLAPFSGALSWRPALLLTAASGTGKSTILDLIISPLAAPCAFSGGESSAPGIRQAVGIDSCAVVIEESETDTKKKADARDDQFSLMRQSTSDKSPQAAKGTSDGKGVKYRLRSMFAFIAISPEVSAEADENRFVRTSLVKATYSRREWLKREKAVKVAITPENCRAVRSYTWKNLKNIISLAERVADVSQVTITGDNRTSFAESLLIAAFMAVFQDELDPTDETIAGFVKYVYGMTPREPRRNENEEMLDHILDHIVREGRDTFTIRELLIATETGLLGEYENKETMARRTAGLYGVGLSPPPECHIAIAKDHPQLMKILEKGKGYHRQLWRHPNMVEKGKNVSLGSGNTRNCVLIEREGPDDE